jgi:hypothetical protein
MAHPPRRHARVAVSAFSTIRDLVPAMGTRSRMASKDVTRPPLESQLEQRVDGASTTPTCPHGGEHFRHHPRPGTATRLPEQNDRASDGPAYRGAQAPVGRAPMTPRHGPLRTSGPGRRRRLRAHELGDILRALTPPPAGCRCCVLNRPANARYAPARSRSCVRAPRARPAARPSATTPKSPPHRGVCRRVC